MRIEDFYQMFRQVVVDMAYNPPYLVNSFAVVDQVPDIRHPSFGYSMEDYHGGRFWSRTWVNGGAAAEGLKGEFPALFVENRVVMQECPNSQDVEATLWLVLVDKIKCEGCPPGILRTGSAIKEQLRDSLRAILSEFYTYQLFEVDGDPVTYEWLAKGRAQIDTRTLTFTDDVEAMVVPDSLEIGDWGNYKDFRGQYAKLKVRFCWPTQSQFDYSNPVVPQLAYTTCPC